MTEFTYFFCICFARRSKDPHFLISFTVKKAAMDQIRDDGLVLEQDQPHDQNFSKKPEESWNEVDAERKCWVDADGQHYTEREMLRIIEDRYDALDESKFVPLSLR